MVDPSYRPVFELTRGKVRESLHFGALAVVDARGDLVASYGDPQTVTFLRSAAKPFQVMPFLEAGGNAEYQLTDCEVAVMCASHSGTDEHLAVVRSIQQKVGISEDELLCGIHPPYHKPTARMLAARGEEPSQNRHNCSGKHTGMLAFSRLLRSRKGNEISDLPYIDKGHPVQAAILKTFSEMCAIPQDQVELGIDGCSVPVFAVPLFNAAFGYARLCDPYALEASRAVICRAITGAMMDNPFMIGGPDSFDTRLMQVTHGRVVSKGGAEGFQALGIMPGMIKPGSPGMGIAIKVSDGDLGSRMADTDDGEGRVRPAIALEVLRMLGVLNTDDLERLAGYGPSFPIYNWRKIQVGRGRPVFSL